MEKSLSHYISPKTVIRGKTAWSIAKHKIKEICDNPLIIGRSKSTINIRNRIENDIKELPQGSNIRLCKGIYKEKEDIAYKQYEDINNNFLKLLQIAFKRNIYVGIASHDKALIKNCFKLIKKMNINPNNFEFQYLHGVPMSDMIKIFKEKKYKVRAYVPFGENWYEYSIRRIKENPKIASYIIKNIFQ